MLSCLYSHTWSGEIGSSCPVCGGKGSVGVSSGNRVYTQFMGADELAMALENKRHLESRSDEILSGAINIQEKGLRIPRELRAELPDSMKKYSR